MGMRKIHYGWVICVTCTLLLFVTMGTVSNGFSIYLPYIMAERGLTHAQTSSLVTLRLCSNDGVWLGAYKCGWTNLINSRICCLITLKVK